MEAENKKLRNENLNAVSGGKNANLAYDENAYPDGPCPCCKKGILHEQVSSSYPCRVLVCNSCYTAYAFE